MYEFSSWATTTILLPLALAGSIGVTGQSTREVTDFLADTVARNRDNLKLRDASVSISGSAPGSILRLTTGHAEEWPGITLVAPDKSWDLSGWASIVLTVRNPGSRIEQIFCRVDNAGANGASNCLTGSLMLNPGITTTLRMPLVTADEQNLKGTLSGI